MTETSFSLIGMAAKGGWLMIILAILSIAALYIFGERFWALRKCRPVDKNFLKDFKDYLLDGKVRSAKALCARNNGPVARMLVKGMSRMDNGTSSEIQTAMENVANVEIQKLEKGLTILSAISGGAPMIGFLGTVIGMVQAFFSMAAAGNNVDIALLSGGIYTAMITTVGGLIVGILAYFAYHFLVGRIADVAASMDSAVVDFIDTVAAIRNKAE